MESILRKSNKISEACRNEGNRLYIKKKFFDAILKYNESLCYSENKSENAGMAYANRSAVYFEMKLYKNCLRNIELAKSHNYPEKNFHILNKREEKCQNLMKNSQTMNNDDEVNFFKLSYEGHKNLTSVANCLELKYDKKYGRHIVTNKDLSVGDIVAIEDPVFQVIKADDRYSTCYNSNVYQRCSNCLNENLLDLIPCESCTKTMFCSEKCKNYSQSNYHKYECPIIDELLQSGIKHIILKILFESISIFNHNIENFKRFINDHSETNLTIFQTFISSKKRENLLLATLSLSSVTEQNENSLEDFIKIFQKTSTLKLLWKDHMGFISGILQKLIIIGNRDIHGIGSWSLRQNGIENHEELKNPSQYQQIIGNACFLFSSLLNHSCAPNIKRLNYKNKNIIIVSRPIKAGQQLFDSYRQNFNLQVKEERQENLLKHYGFKCDCEACMNNWPINSQLKVIDESLLEYVWESHDELPYLIDSKIAEKRFREYCIVFTKHHADFPSAELIVLQECISNCLLSITKPSFQFP
ncbi:hypothetical protein PVAND_001307 [Polypedilum vanderplanki]|uniref:Uncharacterized protein n=1 Tax=Polypedilum vanderplanki TaxID=319348 RepID=A0A9J6BN04_POLVA|nr:hypothetical protein PVAND_001307 [Polypedilum vanderplanki]